MSILLTALAAAVVGACAWSFLKRLTGKKTCCGTEKPPRLRQKKLSAPIGRLKITVDGMRCESCRRRVTVALDALQGVAAKVDLETGTASVVFERPVGDEELTRAIEDAGFDVREISRPSGRIDGRA